MANLSNMNVNGDLIVSDVLNVPGADFVVERGTVGSSWYTIWNSGWKECGGIMPPNAAALTTQTFPIVFTSMPAVTTTFLYGNDGAGYYQYLCPRSISTTGFTINTYTNYCQGTAWRAEGF